MPFTFSHPAIVLPFVKLSKRWFSLTGLVIGSMVPDFEYFFRMRVQSNYSHTLYGIIWFDLPVGISLAFVFHNIVRNSLIDNLPMVLKSRLSVFKDFNWCFYFKSNLLIVIVSILIGTLTHLIWDSFTHVNGYFVERISALQLVVDIMHMPVPVFKLFQHLSTLIGGLVIMYSISQLPQREIENVHFRTAYWALVSAMTFLIVTIRMISGLEYKMYGHLIVTFISAILIAMVLTPVILKRVHNGS